MSLKTQKDNSDRRYAVFLSYRHADNKEQGRQWAVWLHQVLEGYEIPADLIGTRNGKGDLIPPSLYPVFRDEEELPADADLTRNIRRALENSDLLVVLCSPRAVESRFVADEIRYFKELGKADRILALMLDGEPNASDDPGKAKLGIKPEAECLPEPLRYGVAGDEGRIDWSQRTEPIAADVRPAGMPEQGWTTGAAYREALSKNGKPNEKEIAQKVREYEERLELAKLKVVAGALGVPLGVLRQRDKAMQLQKAKQRARTMRRWLAAVGVLAVLALAGGVYAWFQRAEAVKQRDLVAERETAARNTASETDFAIADLKLQTGEVPTGLAHLSRSLRNNPRNAKASSRVLSLPRHLSFPISKLFHKDIVRTATFSPDGKRIVTTAEDNTAQVWDVESGKAVGEPMRHQVYVDSPIFSPDGRWIVIVPEEKIAQVCDAQSGKAVGEPMRHEETVFSASFSPDGKWIVTGSADKKAQVWEAHSGKPVGEPMLHEGLVFLTTFSPDGKWIVTVSVSTARVWDAQSGEAVGEPLWHGATVNTASFSPDAKWIVTAAKDNAARVWDAQSGKLLGEPMRHEGDVNTATFSPDGKCIVTASHDGTARIWDAQSGKAVGEPMRHQGYVWAANFSADGKWIVTASEDKTARVWDAGLVTSEAPDWLMGVAEALGGLHFDSKEVLEPTKKSPLQLREELRGLTGVDELSQFGRWFVNDPATRTISPLSSITVPEFVSQRLMENTPDSVEEAYLVDPGNPLVVASLTKFDQDKDRALFLCRHAIKRARMEGGEALVEQVRAIVLSAIPDFTE